MNAERKKVKYGFTCGSFDLCHIGHIKMLEEAKKQCEYLIVAVQEDPTLDRPQKNKPIQPLKERAEIVKAIRYVDEVLLYRTEEDLIELLKKLMSENKIDLRIVGIDWQGKEFTGWNLGIPIYYNSRNHGYSSTELRQRVYEAEKEKLESQKKNS